MPKSREDQRQPTKKPATQETKKDAERHQAEQNIAEQLPSETTPAEERGERLSTGKTIARGGHPENRQ